MVMIPDDPVLDPTFEPGDRFFCKLHTFIGDGAGSEEHYIDDEPEAMCSIQVYVAPQWAKCEVCGNPVHTSIAGVADADEFVPGIDDAVASDFS